MAKVLIADDEPAILQVLGTILQGAGHTPIPATDGEMALNLFQQHRPPVAILDVMMPRIAGQGLCVKIKRIAPDTGVLLISGVMTDPVFIKSAPATFKNDGYLLKPFTAEQLLAAIKPLLDRAPAEEPSLLLGEPSNPGTPAAAPGRPAQPAAANPWPNRAAQPVSAPPPSVPKATVPAGAPPATPSVPPRPPTGAPPVSSGTQQSLGPQPSFSVDGSLEKTSVVSLLYRCWIEKLYGRLTFKKDVATKEIWVRDGKLVYATSNLETDRMEHKLLSDGKLTGEQYKDVSVLAKAMGSVEAALVQLKIVAPGDVFEASKVVAVALVLDVFKWLGGKYVFTQGSAPPSNLALELPIEDLIHRGLKEAFDLDRLQRALGGRLRAPAEKDLVRIADVERLKLTPAEYRLSRMIDAKKTPEAIAKEFAAGDAAKELRALQILYLMTEAGMMRFAETQETKKAAAEMEGLRAKLVQLEKGTLFDALGLKKDAGVIEVKKAYFALAKQFHPDTLPTDAPPEARKLIEGIFSIISRANQVLQDQKQRDEYLRELEGADATAGLDADNILNAEMEFQKGEFLLLKRRDLAQAEIHLTAALKLNPNEAEHHVLWGWLVWLKSKKPAEAIKHMEAGLKLRPNVASAWLFMGHIYKAQNDMEKAEKAYRKCISIDEKNAEAMSELRLMAMRKGKK